jgi:hypothetical protein
MKICDNVTRMRREYEAQRGALREVQCPPVDLNKQVPQRK